MSAEKRLIRSKSGLRILPIKDSERSPFELAEPEWIKDNEASTCLGCKMNFDIVRRKHHCRRCGQIYCNSCCKTRLSLPRMCFLDPVRHCTKCVHKTSQENDFYEKELKNLTAGFLVQVGEVPANSEAELLHCCLSQNYRHLVISGPENQSIPLYNITAVTELSSEVDLKKRSNRVCLAVSGRDSVMELSSPPTRPDGVPEEGGLVACDHFLWALHKALYMAEEARAIIGTGK